ncbi:hypothetical protein EJB05_27457, partial [Eragrostis curvula]
MSWRRRAAGGELPRHAAWQCRGLGPRVTVEVACSPWPELHHQVLPARTVDQPEPEPEPRPQFAPPSSEGAAMDGALAEIDIPGSHRLLLRVHCPGSASTESMANSTGQLQPGGGQQGAEVLYDAVVEDGAASEQEYGASSRGGDESMGGRRRGACATG